MLSLRTMLGDVPVRSFLDDNFQRLPSSGQFHLEQLSGCDVRQCIAHAVQTQKADVMIRRRNQRFDGRLPATDAEIAALSTEGYTFVVRHAELWSADLHELAKTFERDFATQSNIHLYSTPASEFGFGWHYDAEEVFIFQTEGEKIYELRKNTVNPWPVEESLPNDMQYEREIMPLWKCPLAAGDWLYIPSGYWHRATAGSNSLSIAIGLRPVTALDIWDYLRATLSSNLVWRQRFPPTGEINSDRAALSAELSRCLDVLKTEAAKLFADAHLPEDLIRLWCGNDG